MTIEEFRAGYIRRIRRFELWVLKSQNAGNVGREMEEYDWEQVLGPWLEADFILEQQEFSDV